VLVIPEEMKKLLEEKRAAQIDGDVAAERADKEPAERKGKASAPGKDKQSAAPAPAKDKQPKPAGKGPQ